MKMSKFCSFLLVIVSSFLFQTRGYLIDVTGNAFGETSEGFLAAFGDFDSDKKTDLFVITENGKSLSVFFAKDEGHFVKSVLVNSNATQGFIITGVVPADFDGDSQMDVLLVKHDEGQITQPCTVEIHWGSPSGKSLDVVPTVLPETFQDQPLVMDANGDFIPDLFGENSQGNRSYWIFSATRNVTKQQVVNGSSNNLFPSLKKPHGSAFVDLDKDLTPDLLVVSQDGEGKVQFEWWLVQNGKLTWNKTVPIMDPPEGGSWKHVGIVTFSDINHDEQVNLVVPVCEDDDCTKSHILIYSDKWIKVEVNLERPGSKDSYGFVPPSKHPMTETVTVPIMLRVADYSMDGYPDLIVTLYNTQNTSSSPKTYILINTACPDCAGLKRSFSVVWEGTDLTPTESAVIPTFYDYEDNGNLDVIITAYAEKTKLSRLKLFQSKSTDNMCFLKVMVLSGLCNGKCPHGAESYGVNLPGPTTWYHTLNSEGDPQISTVTQLSQSAHFALQTPYTIIGLGPTPNFVEEFTVGVQHPDKEPLNKSWTYIVPNSQLIVIPTPQETPSSWKYKLFMTPSELVLLTGASLLGTCGLIGIIVGLLHWRERVADKREKLQESQKFHFDAM